MERYHKGLQRLSSDYIMPSFFCAVAKKSPESCFEDSWGELKLPAASFALAFAVHVTTIKIG